MSDYAERLLAARSQVYSGRSSPSTPSPRKRAAAASPASPAPCRWAGGSSTSPPCRCRTAATARAAASRPWAWCPSSWASPREVLESHYLLQIALLDPDCHAELERQFVLPNFDVAAVHAAAAHRRLPRHRRPGGPPAGRAPLRRAGEAGGADGLRRDSRAGRTCRRASWRTSSSGATPTGSTTRSTPRWARSGPSCSRHARNLLIFKIVGYAEQNVEYYQLQDFKAHVWIAHQRYPTKGRVWHPGGAHPFVGLNEALVHNGDFANYHSVMRVPAPAQHPPAVPDRHRGLGAALRPVGPGLRVSAGVHHRGAGADHRARLRPVAAGEAGASTAQIQATHIHASPDGPWFFIIARSQRRTSSSCWASPTPRCCARRCSPSPTAARCRSA